ncbi:bifunctional 2-polyprenyl-6-hydroxyphenol methylase/3-demethylubiquinol 3-O-methyltransferase UbiG [Dysgonomonas sp. 511]|uniref:class I SAM-dependent methyltransferase n=1 Tax=Dysgonomonas sp. 511 TaxID=2302930 RepID=UPI0013D0F14E|nr:class I SAM-dependent methyltransferase [Dysgonomonas sp. 511]NDV77581.1 class I SAM-dependent methyltransferase [Dysgonomonas sp. 511]
MEEKNSFKAEFFEVLYQSEGSSFWFRARNRLVIWLMKKYSPRFQQFLEIGCGTGYVLNGIKKKFPEAHYTGSEYFAEGLGYAKMRMPDVNLIQLDAKNMDDKEKYDAIGIFDVLEHIDEDETVLRNIYNGLTSTGKLYITVPQHKFMWSSIDVSACHERRYTQKELKNKMIEAGFDVKYMSGFVSLLFPAMWLSRKTQQEEDMAEIKINKIIDKLFSFIMYIEYLMMQCGVRFKFGGSIIAVGVKK